MFWTWSLISTIKTTWYVWAIVVFEYLNIPQSQVSILAMLMILDFCVWVGKRLRIEPRKVTSHRAWLGVMKKVSTFIALGAIALMFKWIGMEADKYINGFLAILIMAETYSIIQNVYAIRTGNILPEYDVISLLLQKIGKMIESRLDELDSNKK